MDESGTSFSGSSVSNMAFVSVECTETPSVRHILHVSPTHYSADSVIGGGEKYVVYMCRALRKAAPGLGLVINNRILAFGDRACVYDISAELKCELLTGRPWDPYSISPQILASQLEQADLVVVHQCLSAFGLFVASHAKLLNKRTVGLDHGGGEHPLVHATSHMGRLFNLLHAYSEFGANSYRGLGAPVNVVAGPVDEEYYRPDFSVARDRNMVLSVGRLLPHKGFDRIIRALPQSLHLTILGTGGDIAYSAHLDSLREGKEVRILKDLSDHEVLHHMRSAGIYVHASTHHDYRGTFYAKPELLGLAPLEAMSTGLPALVSTAGSLPELANAAGCVVFRDDNHLAEILAIHAANLFDFPAPQIISREVECKYGLEAFGNKFLRGAMSLLK